MPDITLPDNVDMGEYDVLEHGEVHAGHLEETVAYNTSPISPSQDSSHRTYSKQKTLPIHIPGKMNPNSDYDTFRTSSNQLTLESEDRRIWKTLREKRKWTPDDDTSTSTDSSPSSLIFKMSPIN